MNTTKIYNASNVENSTVTQGEHITLNLRDNQHIKDEGIKQALASLRQAIESDSELSQAQRQAAVSDLTGLTEEFKKPSDKQNLETKKFFWGRLTEIMKFSAALITLSSTIVKVIGLI